MKKLIFLIYFSFSILMGDAQETFQMLCEKGENEVENNNLPKALSYYDQAITIGCEDKSKIIWIATLSSMCAMQLGEEKLAIKYNNIAIDNGCEEILLIDQQLELAKKLKDLGTLEAVLLKARNIEGKFEKYSIKLLYFYYNNKKYPETIVTADEVLKLKPGNYNSRYLKGVALLKTSKEEEAIEIFKRLLSNHPNDSRVNTQLGLFYFNKGSSIFDKENTRYKSIDKPTRLDYHNYRQEIINSLPDYRICLNYLEKANATTPKQYITDAIALAKSRLRQMQPQE